MPDGSVMHVRYCLDDKWVWRVGYGAMQLAGDGVFGPPRDGDMRSRCLILVYRCPGFVGSEACHQRRRYNIDIQYL
jgi:hypothetical protein